MKDFSRIPMTCVSRPSLRLFVGCLREVLYVTYRACEMMVRAGKFVDGLKAAGIGLFAGVPDSQLKSFCVYVTDTCGESHVIAAKEDGAVGWPAGMPEI